ncbi:RidA family protein [Paenibacillus silvisoli]|uniref:RidA family protein n=1 Tax=Paenibacillus silvisoli TaxID=3110539 RepID=UPI002804185B|nr:Rid family detoxifying hydrolase [Paenibacillus silvisoli]
MRKAVRAVKSSKGDGPYSQAIVSRGFVYVSGQGPLDPETGAIAGETIEEQAELTLRNIQHIVEAAGASLASVVKVTVFLSSMDDFERFNVVYRRFFQSPYPARTCVGCQLGAIMVEVDAIAELPEKREGAAE